MDSPRIVLHRDPGGWVDRLRSYRVFIDGVRVGDIQRGGTRTFEVAPGDHQVELRIDWCRSRPLDVHLDPGREARLECRSNATWWNAPLKVVVATRNYIRLDPAA
jgi:hypothetical protein